jgi:hypothetical protein
MKLTYGKPHRLQLLQVLSFIKLPKDSDDTRKRSFKPLNKVYLKMIKLNQNEI